MMRVILFAAIFQLQQIADGLLMTGYQNVISRSLYLLCNSQISEVENLAINGIDEPRSLCEVTFSFPTGLLISDFGDTSYCLLQHNVVNLRPNYRKVFELDGAFSDSICKNIIDEAEVCAAKIGGWTANRHSAYPTTDLPLESIFGKFSSIHGLVNGDILPQIASFFGLNEDYLSIGELFVAKYEFGVKKQAGLGAHVDGTPWSFVVSLNDPQTEFTGGGTRFVESNAIYRPVRAGTAVIFSGKNQHEGVRITSGVRYILTGFCNYMDPNVSHENFMASYNPIYDGSAAAGTEGAGPREGVVAERHSTVWGTGAVRSEVGGDMVEQDSDSADESREEGRESNSGSGIQVGDILRGIWIQDSGLDSTEKIENIENSSGSQNYICKDTHYNAHDGSSIDHHGGSGREGGKYVMLEGLTTDEIKRIVTISGLSKSTPCSVLVQRDNLEEEECSDNEEHRNIPRIMPKLLSMGKYWSYDEFLSPPSAPA